MNAKTIADPKRVAKAVEKVVFMSFPFRKKLKNDVSIPKGRITKKKLAYA